MKTCASSFNKAVFNKKLRNNSIELVSYLLLSHFVWFDKDDTNGHFVITKLNTSGLYGKYYLQNQLIEVTRDEPSTTEQQQ